MSRIYDDDLTTSFLQLLSHTQSTSSLLLTFFEPLVQTSHVTIIQINLTYRLSISHLNLLSYCGHISQQLNLLSIPIHHFGSSSAYTTYIYIQPTQFSARSTLTTQSKHPHRQDEHQNGQDVRKDPRLLRRELRQQQQ